MWPRVCILPGSLETPGLLTREQLGPAGGAEPVGATVTPQKDLRSFLELPCFFRALHPAVTPACSDLPRLALRVFLLRDHSLPGRVLSPRL